MKKHRIVPILSATLALLLLCSLSGCGGQRAENAKTSVTDKPETDSITPAAPIIGGPGASLMGPLYYDYDPEEADSAGLTSPVIRPPVEEAPADTDAQGATDEGTQSAESADAQAAANADAQSATEAATVTTAGTSDGATVPDAQTASSEYQKGYMAGEAAGYAQGYKAGYDEGGGVGYNNGYKAGRTAGYAEIAGIVTSRIADNTD